MMISVAYLDMDKYYDKVSTYDRLMTSKLFLMETINYYGND